MTLRQWMFGVSVAGAIGFAGMSALAKPPDLPVEQGYFCRDNETTEVPCTDISEPLIRNRQQNAQDDDSTNSDAPDSNTERTHRMISKDARSEMCAERVPMQVRQELPQIQRVNYREEVIEGSEPPPLRRPQREASEDDETTRYRNMLRRTKPLGLVPMVLISEHGTWSFLGQP